VKIFELFSFVKRAYLRKKFSNSLNYQIKICDNKNIELYEMTCDAMSLYEFFDTSYFSENLKIKPIIEAFLLNNPENRQIAQAFDSKIYYLKKI